MDEKRKEFVSGLSGVMLKYVDDLIEQWDEIGLNSDQVDRRIESIKVFAENVMKKALNEDTNKKRKLISSIEQSGFKVYDLNKELGLPPVEPDEDFKLLELECFLESKLEELMQEKDRRLALYRQLKDAENELCVILGVTSKSTPSDNILTLPQLDELKKNIEKLTKEKDMRLCTVGALKKSITQLLEKLEMGPDSSFEESIVHSKNPISLSIVTIDAMKAVKEKLECELKRNAFRAEKLQQRLVELWNFLEVPADDRDSSLTADQLVTPTLIKNLTEQVKALEKQKLDNIHTYISKLREELNIYWDKCRCSQADKNNFKPYRSDNFSDVLLQQHEAELNRLKLYYSECQPMLEMYAKREDLWKRMLDLEKRANDPNRLHKRGGNLLQEEKEHKKLMVQIPRLEKEMEKAVASWESQNKKQFCIYDKPLMDFIRDQWDDYQQEKENEKLERRQQKANQLESEMMTGSRLGPSGKRPRIPMGTPQSARANKIPKTTPTTVPHCSRNLTSRFCGQSSVSTFSTPLGKPPKSASKTTITGKKKPVQRRLLQKTQQSSRRAAALEPCIVLRDSKFVNQQDSAFLRTSNISTYSDFQIPLIVPGGEIPLNSTAAQQSDTRSTDPPNEVPLFQNLGE